MKVGFFEVSSGNKSMIRLLSFMAFFAAVVYSIVAKTDPDPMTKYDFYIFLGFLTAPFVPKAIQKFAEMKLDNICQETQVKSTS